MYTYNNWMDWHSQSSFGLANISDRPVGNENFGGIFLSSPA
jgi:hypothetical protein